MTKQSFIINAKLIWRSRYILLLIIFISSILFGFYIISHMSQGTASIRNLTLIINDDDASKTTYDEYDWNYENDYNIYNSMSMGDILIIELKFFPFSITEIIQKSYPEHKYNLFIIPVVTFLDFWGFKDTSNSFINYITDIPIRDNYFGKLTPWRTCKLFFLDIEIMEVHHLSYPRKMIKIIPDALF